MIVLLTWQGRGVFLQTSELTQEMTLQVGACCWGLAQMGSSQAMWLGMDLGFAAQLDQSDWMAEVEEEGVGEEEGENSHYSPLLFHLAARDPQILR